MFALRVDDELSLELVQEEHAAPLFALVEANRAYLRRWLPWLDQNTAVEHTRSWVRSNLQAFAARAGLVCAIRAGGALHGVVGLNTIDWSNRRTAIGYWLSEASQGRGYMTRACSGLLDHAFGTLGLHLAEIGCAVGNSKSCAIPARLGFAKDGVLRQREWLYDRYVDHVVYSMLAGEWRARRGVPA